MPKLSDKLRKKANALFSEMSKNMYDLGESHEDMMDESKVWYPRVFVKADTEGYNAGDELNLFGVGKIKSVREGELEIEIQKVGLTSEEDYE